MTLMPLSSLKGFEGSGWVVAALALATLVGWWIRTRPAQTKADSEAKAARHEESLEHIRLLQEECQGLRDRLVEVEDGWRRRVQSLEREYDDHRRECRQETDELRELIRNLQKQVDGQQRLIAQNSQSTAHVISDLNHD